MASAGSVSKIAGSGEVKTMVSSSKSIGTPLFLLSNLAPNGMLFVPSP